MTDHTLTPEAYERPNAVPLPAIHLSEDEPSDGYLYLHAPRHMTRNDGQMAAAIDIMRKKSPLGRYITDRAREGRVRFARKEFGDRTLGLSIGDRVYLSTKTSLAEEVCILPHEIMHWIQPRNRLQDHWDYRSRLLSVLSLEAGAEACAVRVTHEVRENGYADAFHAVASNPSWRAYNNIFREFDYVLRRSRRRNRQDPVSDATDAAFHKYFEQDALVRNYGEKVLLNYMENLFDYAIYCPEYCFGPEAAGEFARLNDRDYLVYDPVELPQNDKKLFRYNRPLRQAFEYAEMIQILNYCNADEGHPLFRQKLESLVQDGNRFRRLNLSRILSEYEDRKAQGGSYSVVDVMRDQARLG